MVNKLCNNWFGYSFLKLSITNWWKANWPRPKRVPATMTMAPERCARPGFEISMSSSSSSSSASSIPSSPTLTVYSHRRTLGLAKYSSFSFPSSPILLTYLHHHRQGLIVQKISSLTSLSWPKSSTKPENPAIQSQSTSWWSYDHLRHSLQLGFVFIVQSFHKVSIHWGASRSSILQGVVACLLFLDINVHVFMLALHVHENKHIANQKSR